MSDDLNLEQQAANFQHQLIGVSMDSMAPVGEAIPFPNPHPGAQWFPRTGLGLFLHWGISAVDGTIDLSWGMITGTPWSVTEKKITPFEYWKLAERFNPTAYDPNLWLEAAKRAGFNYAVLTTRHHDGFALWPSEHGDFSTKTYLGGRDLVAPFVEACRRHDLKVGLYYSPPDWRWNQHRMSFGWQDDPNTDTNFGVSAEQPALDIHHQTTQLRVLSDAEKVRQEAEFEAYVKGQVEELLVLYKPDLMWFDGAPAAISIERMRELQPAIVVNPRMHGYGDYQTFECRYPTEPPTGWWEMCSIWGDSWGYNKNENYKSAEWMREEHERISAWGGNYLINVAPRPDGSLPAVVYEAFKQLELRQSTKRQIL